MIPSEFVEKVVSGYENNIGIFANKINAEDLVPSSITDEQKALFLFYVIQIDYATKSQNLYKGATLLFNKNPDFFTPKYILALSENNLSELLQTNLHPRYINEALLRYKLNSQKLSTEYDSDPRKIFEQSKTAQEALKKVHTFRGFGPKIGNFFVRSMINEFNYKYDDIDEILPPVDVHDVRIAYLLGYTDSEQMTQKNINYVKSVWNKACKDSGKSWLVFDKALWLLGSEGKPKTKSEILELI